MKRVPLVVILSAIACCAPAATGVAVAGNSSAQDLAVDRFRACDHFATVQLQRIEMSGRVMVTGAEYEAEPFRECMTEMARTQGAALPVDPVVVNQIEGASS